MKNEVNSGKPFLKGNHEPSPKRNQRKGVETISKESSLKKFSRSAPYPTHIKEKDNDIVHAKGNFGTNVIDW